MQEKEEKKKGIKIITAVQKEIQEEKVLKTENTCSETNCSNYCSDWND